MGVSVHQKSYDLLREMLRRRLVTAMQSGPDGIGAIAWRACAVTYELLCDHPVDRRGRCRSCRRPGAVFGLRRRRCRVYRAASFYLRQPNAFLFGHLTSELKLDGVAPDAGDAPAQPLQTPAVSAPPPHPGGAPRPVPAHG
ncbi:MAG: hypothetical protein ACRDRT_09010, partial [Pseudonocardiaceae bacterium]